MASGMNPNVPQPDVEVISVSKVSPTASSSRFSASGRENDEPFGSLFDANDVSNIGFVDDQMLMDVLRENNVIDTSPVK